MKPQISHSFAAETPEGKARWFAELTMAERIDYLNEITDLAFALNPHIADTKDVQPIPGRIQIISRK